MRYRFDRFELDDSTFELRRDGKPLHVEPKALDILLFLIAHRDAVVSTQELLDAMWPDTTVGVNALTRAVSQVRKALGDDPRSARLILTVPRRGYRFVAPLADEHQRTAMPRTWSWTAPMRFSPIALAITAVVTLCVQSDPQVMISRTVPLARPVAGPAEAVTADAVASVEHSVETIGRAHAALPKTELVRVKQFALVSNNTLFDKAPPKRASIKGQSQLFLKKRPPDSARKLRSARALFHKPMHGGSPKPRPARGVFDKRT